METLRDKSFKHFDLPVNHLTRHGHYTPPKARDEAEIERRRQRPPGALIAEQQEKGTAVAAKLLDFMKDKEDSDFVPKLIAAAGINTAWHNHAQGAEDVMRRRLWLPVHANRRAEITAPVLYEEASAGFDEAALLATYLRKSIEARNSAIWSFRKKYGRRLGNASLVLACVPKAEVIAEGWNEVEQQYHTRQAGLVVLEASRNLEEHVGTNPTLAQLADNDSPMSVYIRRHGTNLSVEGLEFATSS